MIEAVIPFPNIDPVLIHIYGPISIRWYALSYIAGLLLGWWYVLRLLRDRSLWEGTPFKGKAPATADDIGDLFVWITLGVIIGGRLGFVLFYGVLYCGFAGDAARACGGLPGAYLANPVRIIAAWEGGMSFHGGLLGVVIAIWWFCRRRKLNLFAVSDLIAAATPIGSVLWPDRQFHQRRIVGQGHRRALGDDLLQRRHSGREFRPVSGGPGTAASKPALRSAARRRGAVPDPALRYRAIENPPPAGLGGRVVPARLWRVPLCRRVLPRLRNR